MDNKDIYSAFERFEKIVKILPDRDNERKYEGLKNAIVELESLISEAKKDYKKKRYLESYETLRKVRRIYPHNKEVNKLFEEVKTHVRKKRMDDEWKEEHKRREREKLK